jgi:Lipocalin-like domain
LPDGSVTKPWGAHPVGRITYDPNGYVTALLMHELRNEADGLSSPAEIEADFSAYFGTYTVDPGQKVVVHQVTASLSKAHASGEIRRDYKLNEAH